MPWGSSRPHAQHSTAALAPQCPVHTHRKMATVKSATGSGAARLHLLAAGLPVLRQLHALAAQRLCAATTHSQSWRSCSVRLSPGALLVLGSVLARCWCWTQACPCERVCVGRAEGWRMQADGHSAACCSLAGRRNERERRGAHRTPSLRGPSSCSWRPPRTGAACSWSPPPPDHAHQCERSQETWLGDTFATFVVSTH